MTGSFHQPGELISERYEVIRFLGEGGMQEVYRVHDVLMNREAALKTPKNLSAQKRFERSAIVSARVNHPNVAKTLDYFEIDAQLYLVEELIDGDDLQKALLKRLPLVDPYLAARIFHYLAKGVAAAHHAGVVHRDLKPSNVMVADGYNLAAIKVTDFGIAKMAEEELAKAVEEGEASISTSSTAVGALPYMSPEMIDAPRSVTQATDIWSLGAMMYEILSGQKPFGSGLRAVSRIVIASPPPPPEYIGTNSQFKPLGTSLYELILRCLQKDSSDRPTADELVLQCEQLCYPISRRKTGTVRLLWRTNQGFIQDDETGEDAFFHFDSVYGQKPDEGSRVCFAQFPAAPSPRAHPVVVMLPEDVSELEIPLL